MIKQCVASLIIAVSAGAVLAQTPATQQGQTAPVRADPVGQDQAPTQDEARALRQEVSRLRGEVETMRAQQAVEPVRAEPVRAEPALAPSPYSPWREPAAQPVPQPVPQPMPQPERQIYRETTRITVMPAYTSVQVSNVGIETLRSGIKVKADVTLNGVANVPFIFQALLVTPDEQVHTNAQGRPYSATTQIKTGDDVDTDDYDVALDLTNLFSSRPPAELYVQVRVLDVQGNIVTKSGLHTFRRP